MNADSVKDRLKNLQEVELGFALDVLTEEGNDSYPYRRVATQEDFDRW